MDVRFRSRRGVLSSLVLRGELGGVRGAAVVDSLQDVLFELRVQLVRLWRVGEHVLRLDIVEFDGAPLTESRQNEIERALRAVVAAHSGPGLVKVARPARLDRAAGSRLSQPPPPG